jgi:hypothetical protein
VSSDVENVVGLAEMTEESAGLETNCPVAPSTTPVLEEKEMARSMAELRRGLENALKDARLADG